MASPYALPPTTQQCLLCPLGTALFWNWGKGRGGWFEKALYNEDLNLKRFKWTKVLPLQSGNNSHQGRLKGCSEQELWPQGPVPWDLDGLLGEVMGPAGFISWCLWICLVVICLSDTNSSKAWLSVHWPGIAGCWEMMGGIARRVNGYTEWVQAGTPAYPTSRNEAGLPPWGSAMWSSEK